jgi:hypothetical protein
MDSINWKLLFFLAVPAVFLFKFWAMRNRANALPDFDEYKALHNSNMHSGVICYKCNSNHMRNLGVNGKTDDSRVVRCGHCDTALYRTQR